jgi:hypothetical protein
MHLAGAGHNFAETFFHRDCGPSARYGGVIVSAAAIIPAVVATIAGATALARRRLGLGRIVAIAVVVTAAYEGGS